MEIPQLDGYASAYSSLDRSLAFILENGGDPAGLLLSFPLASNDGGRHRRVECRFGELTAICPWTSHPDQGEMLLEYDPFVDLLELKSFKYYLEAFRDVHITQEHLCQKIYNDLYVLLNPKFIRVELNYMPRGGIHTKFHVEGYMADENPLPN
jgi:7-cyano-7-deazaguanine reductase